jgi:hypothetical protein
MARTFYLSCSSLTTECSYTGGNESAASISGALGMFQVGWRQEADTMSDCVIESIQEIVSKMNKAERVLFHICGVIIVDDQRH